MTHEHEGISPEGMQNQEGSIGLTEEERQYFQDQYHLNKGRLTGLKAEYEKVKGDIPKLEQSMAEQQHPGRFEGPLRTEPESHLELFFESRKANLEKQSQELCDQDCGS